MTPRFPEGLLAGLDEKLELAIDERINRLETVCLRKPETGWSEARGFLNEQVGNPGDAGLMDTFLESVQRAVSASGKDYISTIQGLDSGESAGGTRWLQKIVDHIVAGARQLMPALQDRKA